MNGPPQGLTINDVHAMLSRDIGSRYPSKAGLVPNRIKHHTSDGLLVCQGGSTTEWMSTSTDGKRLTCDDSQSNGLSFTYQDQLDGAVRSAPSTLLASSIPLQSVTTGAALTDGRHQFAAVYLPYAATVTGVMWELTTNGVYTPDNENSVGLYSSDGTNLNRVALSANVGTTFSAGAAVYSTAFSTPYSAAAGVYWVGFLWNSSATTTAPQLARMACRAGLTNAGMSGGITLAGYVSGKSVQASSYTWATVTNSASLIWAALY